MVDVKHVATVALSSVLTDWEAGDALSLPTIREVRLALSLLVDGQPDADELRPFLGEGWVIRSRNRPSRMSGTNAVSDAEYELAQVRALAARLGMPERFVADCLRQSEKADKSIAHRQTEIVADLIDLMTGELDQQQQEDWMAVTWWAIIRLSNGNQQRLEVLADNQTNARLMIESQYGHGSIISGPHRLDLMRSR